MFAHIRQSRPDFCTDRGFEVEERAVVGGAPVRCLRHHLPWNLRQERPADVQRGSQFENNYFTEMCSGSEAGSYLRRIDFVYHSTLGLRVIKKKKNGCSGEPRQQNIDAWQSVSHPLVELFHEKRCAPAPHATNNDAQRTTSSQYASNRLVQVLDVYWRSPACGTHQDN